MSTYDKMLKDTKRAAALRSDDLRNKSCVAMNDRPSNDENDSGWKMLEESKSKPEPKWPKIPSYKKKSIVRTPSPILSTTKKLERVEQHEPKTSHR